VGGLVLLAVHYAIATFSPLFFLVNLSRGGRLDGDSFKKPTNLNQLILMKKTILSKYFAVALAAGLALLADKADAQSFDLYSTPATLSGQSLVLNWNPNSSYSINIYGFGKQGPAFLDPSIYHSDPEGGGFYSSAEVGSWGGSLSATSELSGGAVIGLGTSFNAYYSYRPANSSSLSYMGLAYDLGGGNYDYGWISYSTSSDSSTITFLGAAMNTTPNQSITAGQLSAVPEPSTYTLFGLGALALVVAYRRKVA